MPPIGMTGGTAHSGLLTQWILCEPRSWLASVPSLSVIATVPPDQRPQRNTVIESNPVSTFADEPISNVAGSGPVRAG